MLMNQKSKSRNDIATRSFVEFPFAPGIVTLCAGSKAALCKVLGAKNIPLVKTKLKDMPFGVYLPTETWMKLEKVNSPIELTKPGGVSAVFPERWMVGLVGHRGLRAITTTTAEALQDHFSMAERQGEFLLTMPVPGSRSVRA
jgi:hypothetical protein